MITCPNDYCPKFGKEFRDVGALWNHARSLRQNGNPECYIALQNVKFLVKMPVRKTGIKAAIRRWCSNPWNAYLVGWVFEMLLLTVVMPHVCSGYTLQNGCFGGGFKLW